MVVGGREWLGWWGQLVVRDGMQGALPLCSDQLLPEAPPTTAAIAPAAILPSHHSPSADLCMCGPQVVKEILRYRAPAPMVPQMAYTDYPLTQEYSIPRGTLVFPSINAANMQARSRVWCVCARRGTEGRHHRVHCLRQQSGRRSLLLPRPPPFVCVQQLSCVRARRPPLCRASPTRSALTPTA